MSLFAEALGPGWEALPPPLRDFHGRGHRRRFEGRAEVETGPNPLARLVARLFRFPPAGRDVPVRIAVERHAGHERWTRDFGGRVLSSRLTPAGPGRVREALGPAAFDLALTVGEGGLSVAVAGGTLFGLPLPRALLPRSTSTERAEGGRFLFDIGVALPILGPMVRYRGWLEPAEVEEGA